MVLNLVDVVLVLGAHGGVLRYLLVCSAEDVRGSHGLTGDRGGRDHLRRMGVVGFC